MPSSDSNAIPTEEELDGLLTRAHKGDDSVLPGLRKLLRQMPESVAILGGDLARQAENGFIEALGGNNLAFKEALLRKLELMRAELAGPSPSPLERLLVERIVACWLQVQDADFRYAHCQEDCTLEQGDVAAPSLVTTGESSDTE
jgi:hypothetical protein